MTKVPIETKRNRLDLILKDLSWSIQRPGLSANDTKISFLVILLPIMKTWRSLTDADCDEKGDVGEHLPQNIPEVSFTAAVAVLHQLSAPQN